MQLLKLCVYVFSACVKMQSRGEGSCISAPTLWFRLTKSAASLNGSTTPLLCDTFSPNCTRSEVSYIRPICWGSQSDYGQVVTLACVFKVSTCRVKSSGSLFCRRLLHLRRSCVSTRRCCAHDTPLCFMSGSSGPFLIPHHGKTPISQLRLWGPVFLNLQRVCVCYYICEEQSTVRLNLERKSSLCSQVQQPLCVLPLYCCHVHGGLHPGSGGSPRRKHPLWLFHGGMCSRWLQLPLQQGLLKLSELSYTVTPSRLISLMLLFFSSPLGGDIWRSGGGSLPSDPEHGSRHGAHGYRGSLQTGLWGHPEVNDGPERTTHEVNTSGF